MGEAQPHDRVAGLEQGVVDGHVRRRPGVGLDVGVIDAEEALCPRDGYLFHLVDVLLALVIALAGVALGVLVHEDRAHGLQHRRRGVVLGRDEPHGLGLVLLLCLDQGVYLGISRLQL